jgi:hypothetical protein
MASTNYLTRAIFKEHNAEATLPYDYSGTYKLLVAAKSMPSPVSAPNNVETTTMEDDAQTFVKGIKTSDSKEITGNLEKDYLDAVTEFSADDKRADVLQLYGSQGIGEVAKYAYSGQIDATPSDVSGTDAVLEMTVTIIPNSAAKKVTDEYTVVDNKDGTFTVSKNG